MLLLVGVMAREPGVLPSRLVVVEGRLTARLLIAEAGCEAICVPCEATA